MNASFDNLKNFNQTYIDISPQNMELLRSVMEKYFLERAVPAADAHEIAYNVRMHIQIKADEDNQEKLIDELGLGLAKSMIQAAAKMVNECGVPKNKLVSEIVKNIQMRVCIGAEDTKEAERWYHEQEANVAAPVDKDHRVLN